MRKYILLALFLLNITTLFAQSVPRRSIEDSVLGWMKVYNFKGVKESKKVDDKIYSPAQLSICDSFANWIQASYVPKGGLGDIHRIVSDKIGPYNQYEISLPPSYGAYAKTYAFLKYNSSRKLVPENNLGVAWGIVANQVPGWPIRDLSTSTQYFFTMPSFESYHDGGETVKKLHDLSNIPSLKPYTTFWIKSVEAGGGTDYIVISKNNRSPFIKLTKGEYLNELEAAIPRYYENEKKKIHEKDRGNQRSIDYFMKYLDEKKARLVEGLKKCRERYKNRLNEIALTISQPGVTDLEFRDVFSNGSTTDTENTSGRVPVYRVDPEMAELCKKDKPQWIVMYWWWAPNDPSEKHMHESIINNFNFAYLYDFFFDPEKVKGKPYRPLRSPLHKDAVVITEASDASKKNSGDRNIHYYEDFSTSGIGGKPVGWQSRLALDGTTSTIVKRDGLEGNWAMITGNHKITPTNLKKPLPQNFTLSYDLIAAQNYTWGSYGLIFELSKETSPGNAESYLTIKLRPGFDGREGELTIETKFPYPPGYSNGTKWFKANGFSNNKKNNKITVTIKKIDEKLQVFIDDNKVAEYEKAIPSAHLFNQMSFYINGTIGANDKMYVSNIKITKD